MRVSQEKRASKNIQEIGFPNDITGETRRLDGADVKVKENRSS